MTRPIYSKSILDTFTLTELKQIAAQLGTAPVVDKRCKANWIVCILRKQGNLNKADFVTSSGASLVQQPSETPDPEWEVVIKPECPQTQEQFEAQCQEQALLVVGTKSLVELKVYCDRHFINQSSWFEILKGVFDRVFCDICGTAKSYQDSVIVEAIRAAETRSSAICDVLEITVVDLEIVYGNVVIPSGIPSIEIY